MLTGIFSGLGTRISSTQLDPFLSNMHFALWCMCRLSILGAVVSFARPKHVGHHLEVDASIEAETPAEAAAVLMTATHR